MGKVAVVKTKKKILFVSKNFEDSNDVINMARVTSCTLLRYSLAFVLTTFMKVNHAMIKEYLLY